MPKPKLCWKCKGERVRSGMKNAKAKGIKIGRVRKRNDVLIHSLLDAQLSFREIARIAKCSHGSVSAAKKEWLAKKAEAEKKKTDSSATDTTTSEIVPPQTTTMPFEYFETFD